MNLFSLYFKLGFQHITDFNGYDHIVFLLALCSIYFFRHIKQVLILVTAFTIGHSLTLLLATFNVVNASSILIEFVIPLTIFFASIFNLFDAQLLKFKHLYLLKYMLALFFGLVHGLGFSNYLKALLGSENNVWKPLLAFNLGIELGQVLIVFVILILAHAFTRIQIKKEQVWNYVLSVFAIIVSSILMVQRGGDLFL